MKLKLLKNLKVQVLSLMERLESSSLISCERTRHDRKVKVVHLYSAARSPGIYMQNALQLPTQQGYSTKP